MELIQVKLRVPRSAPGWAEVVPYLEEMVFNGGMWEENIFGAISK